MPVIGLRKEFSPEFRERALALVMERQKAEACSVRAATEAVGQEVGCSGAILRRWLKSHAEESPERSYSIKDLLAEFDVSSRTLRFYEQEGLVKPARRGPTRVYSEADRVKVAKIVHLRRLGFSIAEIQQGGLDLDKDPERLRAQQEKLREQKRLLDRSSSRVKQALAGIED